MADSDQTLGAMLNIGLPPSNDVYIVPDVPASDVSSPSVSMLVL